MSRAICDATSLSTAFDYLGQQLRAVMIDGAPWFVAHDCCRILGLNNATMAVRKLAEDERTTLNRIEVGMAPGAPVNAVSRPSHFKLIERSDKPAAKRLNRWVRHEVLPQIMDNGGYVMADAALISGAAKRGWAAVVCKLTAALLELRKHL